MILYFIITHIYIFFLNSDAGPTEANKLSGSAPPFSVAVKETRKAHTHTSRWRPSKLCVRARAYVSTENRFSPYRSLRHERRRFRLSKIAAAVFFPPFDIVARGVVSAIPESKYSFLFCSCLPRLFYVVPMVFSQPKTNTHVEKSIERERERVKERENKNALCNHRYTNDYVRVPRLPPLRRRRG